MFTQKKNGPFIYK